MPDPLSQFHFSMGVTALGSWPGKPLYNGINTLEISFPKMSSFGKLSAWQWDAESAGLW